MTNEEYIVSVTTDDKKEVSITITFEPAKDVNILEAFIKDNGLTGKETASVFNADKLIETTTIGDILAAAKNEPMPTAKAANIITTTFNYLHDAAKLRAAVVLTLFEDAGIGGFVSFKDNPELNEAEALMLKSSLEGVVEQTIQKLMNMGLIKQSNIIVPGE